MSRWVLGVLETLLGLVVGASIVAFLVWLLWRLWARREEEAEAPAIEIDLGVPSAEEQPVMVAELEDAKQEVGAEPEVAPSPPEPDDLKRIEGIGPKIAGVLQKAGVLTFAQLAETEVDGIKRILEESDPRLLRVARPATWPEQAKLAAAGDWEALATLQSELKGGRRVPS
jgi:predicted flap endonuclease-1-like 5' DNA nuclease